MSAKDVVSLFLALAFVYEEDDPDIVVVLGIHGLNHAWLDKYYGKEYVADHCPHHCYCCLRFLQPRLITALPLLLLCRLGAARLRQLADDYSSGTFLARRFVDAVALLNFKPTVVVERPHRPLTLCRVVAASARTSTRTSSRASSAMGRTMAGVAWSSRSGRSGP